MSIIITPDFTEGNYSVGNLLERIDRLQTLNESYAHTIHTLEIFLSKANGEIENYKKLTDALQNKVNMLTAEKREYNQFAYSPH